MLTLVLFAGFAFNQYFTGGPPVDQDSKLVRDRPSAASAGTRTLDMAIAPFSVTDAGIPNVMELFLMPVTQHWLPIESGFEKQLLDRLASDGRSFVKGLRYDLSLSSASASATLTDCEDSAPVLFIADESVDHSGCAAPLSDPSSPVRVWNPSSEAMPMLPPRRPPHISGTGFTENAR